MIICMNREKTERGTMSEHAVRQVCELQGWSDKRAIIDELILMEGIGESEAERLVDLVFDNR